MFGVWFVDGGDDENMPVSYSAFEGRAISRGEAWAGPACRSRIAAIASATGSSISCRPPARQARARSRHLRQAAYPAPKDLCARRPCRAQTRTRSCARRAHRRQHQIAKARKSHQRLAPAPIAAPNRHNSAKLRVRRPRARFRQDHSRHDAAADRVHILGRTAQCDPVRSSLA